jgi:hypothetical protein
LQRFHQNEGHRRERKLQLATPPLLHKDMRPVVWLVLIGCGAQAGRPIPAGVRIWQSQGNASITEGETTLDVDADTAYAAAIDYPRWSKLFPEIVAVNVTRHQGVDALVTLIHGDGNRDNVHFHNQPLRHTVWFEDTGGSADVWAEISFLPGTTPGTTRVHSRLFADVRGFASLFVTTGYLRSKRQQRIASDLSQLHRYFSARNVASH